MSRIKEQFNFNTFLLIVVGALVGLVVKKMDDINTSVIQLSVRMNTVESKVSAIEGVIYIKK